MGNAFRSLCGQRPATVESNGVSSLAHDLFNFEITSQVPEGLREYVASSRKAQANWFAKLLVAWKESNPPPRTAEDASRLVIDTLKRHQKKDVEGLLAYYGLPLPHTLVQISSGFPVSIPPGVKFQIQTLPVDGKAVTDGDTLIVYVSTEDPNEASLVPRDIRTAVAHRSKARSMKNYSKADSLHKKILSSGYRVLNFQNGEVLARKFRIRLRGIDAPESAMPYGLEAKQELVNLVQGKCLRILIYEEDRYGRSVGDVYSNDIFVQEIMLKKGAAWHYTAYDQRPEFAMWESSAKAKKVGLWALKNPEMPWEWRKNQRGGRKE